MALLRFSILIYCTLSLGHTSELRNIDWELVSSENEIEVFAPKNFKHESGIIPIKFKANINHDILKVLSVLADNERKMEWLPRLKAVKEIERISIYELTVYYQYNFPWPFSDRDFVIHTTGSYDPETYIVSVDLKSTKHPKAPLKASLIRGTSHDGYSIIKPAGKKSTKVEMAFLNDFGGWMPSFIINRAQKEWPYNFIKHLRGQLEKDNIKINPAFKR